MILWLFFVKVVDDCFSYVRFLTGFFGLACFVRLHSFSLAPMANECQIRFHLGMYEGDENLCSIETDIIGLSQRALSVSEMYGNFSIKQGLA